MLLYQRVQLFLTLTLPTFLISAAEGWYEGPAGFRPTCLRLTLPPLFPPRLPLQDFSHFCASCCCFGSRKWTRLMGVSCGIPGCLSARAQRGILSYSTYHLFRIHLGYFYSSKHYDRVESLYPFMLSGHLITFCKCLWLLQFSPRFTVEWSHPLYTNLFQDRNKLTLVLVTVMQLWIVHGKGYSWPANTPQ